MIMEHTAPAVLVGVFLMFTKGKAKQKAEGSYPSKT